MKHNLGISKGLIVAEAVMMALAPFTGRQQAHDIVYDACRTVHETGGTLVVPSKKLPWYRKLGMQVLLALVLGIALGLLFPKFGAQLKVLGDLFLALIKTGVAPLVFLTIVHGIASAGDVKSAGRVGWRSIVYFEVVSTIALMVGLLAGIHARDWRMPACCLRDKVCFD
jgi:hypothetical protein